MKTKFLLTVIMVFYLAFDVGWAQPYESIFGGDSTKFHVFMQSYDHTLNNSYYVKSTSNINDSIIYIISDEFGNETSVIHENLESGKAWCFEYGQNKGRLIYDLSLEKGDTFKIRDPYSGDIVILHEINTIVDTTYYLNSKKVIELDNSLYFTDDFSNLKFKFMEGIGTTYGLFYQFRSIAGHQNYLLCWEKDGNLEYLAKGFDNCSSQLKTGIMGNQSIQSISIYPNPMFDIGNIEIEKANNEQYFFCLFDLHGKIVVNKKFSGNLFTLNTLTIENGIYFFRITNSFDQIYYGKILIQN